MFPPYSVRAKVRKEEAESIVTVGNDNKTIDIINKNYRSPFDKGILVARDVMVSFVFFSGTFS